jgi:glycosyltransferase involved in cell wall biosynthesis
MISCLMVTRPTARRIVFAMRSIDCYRRQTHSDRELVVVIDGRASSEDVSALLAQIGSLGRSDIRVEIANGQPSLGALRNLSVAAAGGEVVCQWDDDDLCHPERLERQSAALDPDHRQAVYLQEVMQYFPDRQALYLTNWHATPAAGHPGTLMARRDAAVRYPERGEGADRGEDLEVALGLIARGAVGYLRDAPHLYLYVSHGDNSWDEGHHGMLARTLSVSKGLLLRREAAIREGLAPFGFSTNGIDVTGSNGVAFRL